MVCDSFWKLYKSIYPLIHFYLIILSMVACGRVLGTNPACSGCQRQGTAWTGQVQPVRVKTHRQPHAHMYKEFRVFSSLHLHVFGLWKKTNIEEVFMVVYFDESFSCDKMWVKVCLVTIGKSADLWKLCVSDFLLATVSMVKSQMEQWQRTGFSMGGAFGRVQQSVCELVDGRETLLAAFMDFYGVVVLW